MPLVAYQDVTPLTPREGLIGGLMALVPSVILVLTWWKTRRAEDRKDTIAEYRALYETQTASLVLSQATVGRLTDQLVAERLRNGNLGNDVKNLRRELREARGQPAGDEDENDATAPGADRGG